MIKNKLFKATFGAGCFWSVEYKFSKTKGVISTSVGYEGGSLKNPSYEGVCSDNSGHIEVVELEFNPDIISYKELLGIFFSIHDPTAINKQGYDSGSQYKSIIFYHNVEQKFEAIQFIKDLEKSGKYKKKIVTEIKKASKFYIAEDYHQKYLEKKGLSSCHI